VSGSPPADTWLAATLRSFRLVVCLGSGGVGKTTVSAALGVAAARLGRRACVLTIDPARRLADALGIGALPNEATRVDLPRSGAMWAAMLDAKATFDHLIRKEAKTPEQADRILANRLYQTISSDLGGLSSYMACERLYSLMRDDRFDIVIVDTPPSRSALDFLESPGRLTRFLDNRVVRILVRPSSLYSRALGLTAVPLLRTISRVVGSNAVEDAVDFFAAFEGMEEGFRRRAKDIGDLLISSETAYILVASPRRDSVHEAIELGRELRTRGNEVRGIVVNRVLPDAFGQLKAVDAPSSSGPGNSRLEAWLRRMQFMYERERLFVRGLQGNGASETRLIEVERDPAEVSDLEGIESVSDQLLGTGRRLSLGPPLP
jgi:anion-transporting  ArsA/GET3 family ATPase